MYSKVLILAAAGDAAASAVTTELDRRDIEFVQLDTGEFPTSMTMTARIANGTWQGSLATVDRKIDFAQIKSVYYQRPTQFTFSSGMSDADRSFAAAEARLGFGGVLASMRTRWVNDPTRVALAEYKPMQLAVAARNGLMVPETLITNDPVAVRGFENHIAGPIVCKPLSPLVLSEGGQPRITYTTPIEAGLIDPFSVATTAHLIQRQIAKKYDARVTVVGSQSFAVAIHASSEAAHIDWRADYAALTYTEVEPPFAIAEGMRSYLDTFGLVFGAFDFVVTPDDQWIMLECNPSGQWLWLAHQCDLPIAAALADLLAGETT